MRPTRQREKRHGRGNQTAPAYRMDLSIPCGHESATKCLPLILPIARSRALSLSFALLAHVRLRSEPGLKPSRHKALASMGARRWPPVVEWNLEWKHKVTSSGPLIRAPSKCAAPRRPGAQVAYRGPSTVVGAAQKHAAQRPSARSPVRRGRQKGCPHVTRYNNQRYSRSYMNLSEKD